MKKVMYLVLLLILVTNVYAIDWHNSFLNVNGAYVKNKHSTKSLKTELNLAIKPSDKYRIYENFTFNIAYFDNDLDYLLISNFSRFEKRIKSWFVFWDIDILYSYSSDYAFSFGPGIGKYLIKNKYLKISLGTYPYVRFLTKDNNLTKEFLENIEFRFKLKVKNFALRNRSIYKLIVNKSAEFNSESSILLNINDKQSIGINYSYEKNPYTTISQTYISFNVKL